jgi:acyl carrier protein
MFLKTLTRSLKFNPLLSISKRFFADQSQKMPVLDAKNIKKADNKADTTQIQPWVDIENRLEKLRGELVLSQQDQIEKYVLSVIRGYFRTTYKDGLNLESNLGDHGLDSLDAIEISMILEDELGIRSIKIYRLHY